MISFAFLIAFAFSFALPASDTKVNASGVPGDGRRLESLTAEPSARRLGGRLGEEPGARRLAVDKEGDFRRIAAGPHDGRRDGGPSSPRRREAHNDAWGGVRREARV